MRSGVPRSSQEVKILIRPGSQPRSRLGHRARAGTDLVYACGSSRGLGGEGQELVSSCADDPVACFGQVLAVGGGDRALEWGGDASLPSACLHEPDGARNGVRRVVGQAEGERQVEQDLGVGPPLILGDSDSSIASTRSPGSATRGTSRRPHGPCGHGHPDSTWPPGWDRPLASPVSHHLRLNRRGWACGGPGRWCGRTRPRCAVGPASLKP